MLIQYFFPSHNQIANQNKPFSLGCYPDQVKCQELKPHINMILLSSRRRTEEKLLKVKSEGGEKRNRNEINRGRGSWTSANSAEVTRDTHWFPGQLDETHCLMLLHFLFLVSGSYSQIFKLINLIPSHFPKLLGLSQRIIQTFWLAALLAYSKFWVYI